jgi:hypothetical protein
MKRSLILLTLVILLLLAAVAQAKPDGSSPTSPGADYEIAWWTVDGGGWAFSTGGDYELGGTVGQPDAGESSGGDYGLTGGFWNGASPACAEVAGVDLALATSGVVYTDTVVEFSADIVPDGADKPYTYTVDYGMGASAPAISNDDPLTTPLDHTFTATGTYDVEIAVWNCDMTEVQAVTSVVTLTVYARSACVDLTEITICGDESGAPGIYTFTTSYEPSDATPPIAYLWNNGDDTAISVQSLDVDTHTVVVTATNCSTALVTDTHAIVIQNRIYLPLVMRN